MLKHLKSTSGSNITDSCTQARTHTVMTQRSNQFFNNMIKTANSLTVCTVNNILKKGGKVSILFCTAKGLYRQTIKYKKQSIYLLFSREFGNIILCLQITYCIKCNKLIWQLFNPCKQYCRHSDTVGYRTLNISYWDAFKITTSTASQVALV